MAAEEQEDVLDLSNQGLKKLAKAQGSKSLVTTLILDNNELQRWDNIDSYSGLTKLSACHNQLLRMYSVSRLQHLTSLNLAHNIILTIEGLKDLIHLNWLCLSSNNIKTIEHLHTNTNLEYLDLSDNNIAHITDLSYLKCLKELLLHGNRISQLKLCERHLPPTLLKLSLASNNIVDLNEMSNLGHLTCLREFSLGENPCVSMTGGNVGFDYRPFVINWCMSLKVIDGFVVDAIESLKAEWLYSQGRGRQFRVGEHVSLAQYLAGVCPLSGDSLESEDDRKLRLILSKAQHHQQQLRDQLSTGCARGRIPGLGRSMSSPATRRKNSSPRRSSVGKVTTSGAISQDADRMVASCHSSVAQHEDVDEGTLMTQSLDPSLLFTSTNHLNGTNGSDQSDASNHIAALEDCKDGPLQAASKLVPVPESLMSPDYRPAPPRQIRPPSTPARRSISLPRGGGGPRTPQQARRRPNNPDPAPANSSDEDSEMSASKLETIRHRAQQRWQNKTTAVAVNGIANSIVQPVVVAQQPPCIPEPENKAALVIQRHWRGYRTRNLDRKVMAGLRDLEASRTQQHITKLSSDMEATRAALESERKLQLLQMQAINALWKKVVSLQPRDEAGPSAGGQLSDTAAVKELTLTCSRLHTQVEQLQGSMQSVMQCVSLLCPMAIAASGQAPRGDGSTQTDIVAVHTPQLDPGASPPFPYQRRPSSLPLPQQAVKQFVTSLVDGVMKTVSEQGEAEQVAEEPPTPNNNHPTTP